MNSWKPFNPLGPDAYMFDGNHRTILTGGKQYLKYFSFAFLCFWNNFPHGVLTHNVDKKPGLVLELLLTVTRHYTTLHIIMANAEA